MEPLFGGVSEGPTLAGQMGYPGLPRAALHQGLSDSLSIGGAFTFDLGYYTPEPGLRGGMLLSAPLRLRVAHSSNLSAGMVFEPGLGFFFEPGFNFAVLANVRGNLGWHIGSNMILGGGLDLPVAVAVDPFIFFFPILFGPVYEIHPIDNLAVTAELKFGPSIRVFNSFTDVSFGLKLAVGVAYRF